MQQVWDEIYHLWCNDEQHWLTPDELLLLNESNTDHEQIDPFEEKALAYFDWGSGWQRNPTLVMTATDVLEIIGYENPEKAMQQAWERYSRNSQEKNHIADTIRFLLRGYAAFKVHHCALMLKQCTSYKPYGVSIKTLGSTSYRGIIQHCH